MIQRKLLYVGFALLLSTAAHASTSGISYEGQILKPDGSPLSGQATQFKLQIRTPDSGNCLMYEEVQSLDMRGSGGNFALTINDGSGSRTDTTGLALDRAFGNRGTFTFNATTCASGPGTYTPNAADGRNLVVLFKDETMANWEPLPAEKINFSPLALEAKQIAGFTADSLFRVVDSSGDPLLGVAPLSNAQYSALLSLANGTSTAYSRSNQLNGAPLPAMGSNEVLGWNGTAWVSQHVVSGASSVSTSMIQNAAVTAAAIAPGAITASKLDPAIAISTSGPISSDNLSTRNFKLYAPSPSTNFVNFAANASMSSSYSLTWPVTPGSPGQVLTTDGAGGLSWSASSTSGGTVSGDLSGSLPSPMVASVGGVAANIVGAGSQLAASATSSSTNNAIVRRDSAGDFSANAATVSALKLSNAGSVLNILNPIGGAWTMTLPATAGSGGQVLSTNGAGVTSWIYPSNFADGATPMTGVLKQIDGTATAPGLAFASDNSTGIYRHSLGTLGFSAGGVARMTLSPSQVLFSDNVNTATPGLASFSYSPVMPTAATASGLNIQLAPQYTSSSSVPTTGAKISNMLANNTASSTIDAQSGLDASALVATSAGGSVVTQQYGVRVTNGLASSGGTVTNSYGVFNNPQSGLSGSVITNLYGLYLAAVTGSGTVTSRYGVYQDDPQAKNVFRGPIFAQSSPSGYDPLTVKATDSNVYQATGGALSPWTAGQAAAIVATNDASSAGSAAYVGLTTKNSSALTQRGYIAAISTSGANAALAFGVAGTGSGYTERIRIDQTGKVGIGTTAPTAQLEVFGTAKIGSTGTVVSGLGACSATGTSTANASQTVTCSSVQAGSAVNCSPSNDPGVSWGAMYDSVGTVRIRFSGIPTSAVSSWSCSWVSP